MTEATDRELLAAMRGGDRSAAETFARRHAVWAVDYARRKGAGDQAEDVAQQVLSNLLERPTVALKRASAAPYLRTCILNQISVLRRQQRPHQTPKSHIDPTTSPSSVVARRHALEAVAAELEGLPTAKRELLLARYRDDLEPVEIAHATGRPSATVRKDLTRLHRFLAQKILGG